MRHSKLIVAALAACAGLLGGCSDETPNDLDAEEMDVGLSPAAGGERPPPSGLNGLLPACFWAPGAQQALRSLGTSALDQGGGVLPAIPLSQVPAECRAVLEDTVQCALPDGQSLHDPVTGATYSGWWGLAAGWKTAMLDSSGRRYVTGCLLQRLNATGEHVRILLEGPNTAIQRDSELAGEYPVFESTAYGDLFSSQQSLLGLLPAFNAYVCWEGLIPQGDGLLGLPLLEDRMCDNLPLCGITTVGPCDLACTDNGPYRKCSPGLLAAPWTQTVRVRLPDGT